MLSTFEAENRHLDEHSEPQLKKRCAYKEKMCKALCSRGSTKMIVLSLPDYRTVTSFISVCYRSDRTVIPA